MLLRRLNNNNNKQREKKDINTLVPLSARPLDPTSRCVGVLGSPTHAYFNFMRKMFSCSSWFMYFLRRTSRAKRRVPREVHRHHYRRRRLRRSSIQRTSRAKRRSLRRSSTPRLRPPAECRRCIADVRSRMHSSSTHRRCIRSSTRGVTLDTVRASE